MVNRGLGKVSSCAVIEGVTDISIATRTHPPHRGGSAGQGMGLHSMSLGRAPRVLPRVTHYGQQYILHSHSFFLTFHSFPLWASETCGCLWPGPKTSLSPAPIIFPAWQTLQTHYSNTGEDESPMCTSPLSALFSSLCPPW